MIKYDPNMHSVSRYLPAPSKLSINMLAGYEQNNPENKLCS